MVQGLFLECVIPLADAHDFCRANLNINEMKFKFKFSLNTREKFENFKCWTRGTYASWYIGSTRLICICDDWHTLVLDFNWF